MVDNETTRILREQVGKIETNPANAGYIVTDDDYGRIFSLLGEVQKKENAHRKEFSKTDIRKMRARCKRDLFFLCTTVLGYNRLSPNLHGSVAKWLFLQQYEQFAAVFLPRAHFKTTEGTIAYDIQAALPYTEEDAEFDEYREIEVAYPYNLGTDIRVLLTHEVAEEAKRFLFSITRQFLTNPLLRVLYPECIPDPRKQTINKEALELPRNSYWQEPTFHTMGAGTKGQGRHYDLVDLDDIFGETARDSETESKALKQWFDNIQSFFVYLARSHLRIKGTRYKYDDVYGHAMDVYGDKLKVYKRGVVEVDNMGNEVPIFPEEITLESLEIIKKNPIVYESQYLNDPARLGEGFRPEWWREFEWLDSSHIIVKDGDGSDERRTIHTRDLDIVILIDPGELSGGFTIVGTDYWMRSYVLSSIPIRMSSPSLVEFIFQQVVKWQPSIVSIEADAAQHLFQGWLMTEMRVRQIYFRIHAYFTKKKSKPTRIKSLSNLFAADQLRFSNRLRDSNIHREFKEFGKTSNIHELDALAQLQDETDDNVPLRRRGYAPGTRGFPSSSTIETFHNTDEFDPLTGYSAI